MFITVKVVPKAKKTEIKREGERFKVYLKSPAVFLEKKEIKNPEFYLESERSVRYFLKTSNGV